MILAKEDSDIEKRLRAVEQAMADNRLRISTGGVLVVEDTTTRREFSLIDNSRATVEWCSQLPRCIDTERMALRES
jgi:hypothetical protein